METYKKGDIQIKETYTKKEIYTTTVVRSDLRVPFKPMQCIFCSSEDKENYRPQGGQKIYLRHNQFLQS